MSAETDPLDPHTLLTRINGLENATALALAVLCRSTPEALDRFEDLAVRVNGPDEHDTTRKAFARLARMVRQYQNVLDEMERNPEA